ncbi:MAG: hypothetical protein ACI9U2_001923 [Bradymonadia bacterium]|jgi:hypothetical protein
MMIKGKMTAIQIWRSLRGDNPVQVLAAQSLLRLHGANSELWALEDAVRDRALQSIVVRDMKRAIDRANLDRHAAVAEIDRAIDAAFSPIAAIDDPGVVLNSESIGQMCDRASVLVLKLDAHIGTPREAGVRRRMRLLTCCLDRMLAALAAGKALPQRFDEAKTYTA